MLPATAPLPSEPLKPWLLQLVRASSDPVAVLSRAGVVRHGNSAAAALGCAAAEGSDFLECVALEDRPRVATALRVAESRAGTHALPGCQLGRAEASEVFDLEIGDLEGAWIIVTARRAQRDPNCAASAADWQSAAIGAGRVGVFEWVIPENRLRCSAQFDALCGFSGAGAERSLEVWLARIHAADRPRVHREIERIRRGPSGEHAFEFRVLAGDGAIRWVAGQCRLLQDADGNPARLLGVVIDIDARKRKEIQSEFILNVALALRPLAEPAAMADTTVRLLREHLGADRCAYARFEADEETFEVAGNSVTGLPPMTGKFRLSDFGEDVASMQRAGQPYVLADAQAATLSPASRALFASAGIRAVVAVPLRKAGRLRAGIAVHHASARRWTAEEVELIELAGSLCWESMERAQVAVRLERSERRLRLALTSARMVAWEVDPATGAADVMENAAEVFGIASSSTLNNTNAGFALVHPEDEAAHRALFARTMAEGGSHLTQFRMLRPDGGVIWIEERAYAVCDERGTPTRFVGVMIDITDRKQAEEERRAAHALLADKAAHLEALVRERTSSLQATVAELEAFSYSVAHDLRGPLRSLYGYANILLTEHAEGLNEAGKSFLRRIAKSADRMDRLTRDVLNYNAIVRTNAAQARIDTQELLRDILDTYPALSAESADIEVIGDLPPVLGNAALLTQVFANLLQNAVKFVAPGVRPAIALSAERRGETVKVLIRDNGIGIPAEFQRKIFGMFERLNQEYEGTGIGLAIVKKAIERMGGKLGVDSGPGGSTFWFELPAAP